MTTLKTLNLCRKKIDRLMRMLAVEPPDRGLPLSPCCSALIGQRLDSGKLYCVDCGKNIGSVLVTVRTAA